MVNDTIADTLTRIRNGLLAKHQIVAIPHTKTAENLVQVLKKEGFINDFKKKKVTIKKHFQKSLILLLKYKGKNKRSVIKSLKRISKPGLRVYVGHKALPKVLGGIGIAILSTSKGIITDREARYYGIGGEVLCYIW
uniref:Ribosomal protein S8 n=1 Tax=Neogoniolithon spectabile TaxID=231755 RepID=A0A3G3MGR4_9FLOR|nr:ribosomal protein S8 [Neogoniolithon spectabile]AYR06024.1 ribosomal protein S8 [Neogoniolithon spectabile]